MEMLVGGPDPAFWAGRRVLLTGHTGFKGSWLLEWLEALEARVTGLALPPEGPEALFPALFGRDRPACEIVDIRDGAAVAAAVARARPEIVFHLAAQSLVRRGYADPVGTFAVNVAGTVNLLEALRRVGGVRAILVTTTDKVYRNTGHGRPFVETDPLGGTDPYSESKAACEMVVAGYRASFENAGCGLATARAGNVIGGGDWAADRLVPDAVRAWSGGRVLDVRRPEARRPWQHVLEPLRAYLLMAERLAGGEDLAPAYNIGPTGEGETVRSVIDLAARHFSPARIRYAAEPEGPQEAAVLSLDSSLARRDLGIQPAWSLGEAVEKTAHWYRAFLSGKPARTLCAADREAYLGAVAGGRPIPVAAGAVR